MSVDSSGNNWDSVTERLEATVTSKSESEQKETIEEIFRSSILPSSKPDSETLKRWSKVEESTPGTQFKSQILANALFKKTEKESPLDLGILEERFTLLKSKYPLLFNKAIEQMKKEFGFVTDATTFKQYIVDVELAQLKPEKLKIEDILFFVQDCNIERIKKFFYFYFYTPLVKHATIEFRAEKKVGLRDKPTEIQETFEKGKAEQIKNIKKLFTDKKSFKEIFDSTCLWRSNLAYLCLENTDVVQRFGRVRSTGFISGFQASNAPEELIKKCELLTSSGANSSTKTWAFPESAVKKEFFSRKTLLDSTTIYGYIVKFDKYERREWVKRIPLTTLNHFKGNPEDYDPIEKRLHPGLYHTHSWTHTPSVYISECLQHIEDLYQQLLCRYAPDYKLQLIAGIHWWGCHACPCERGSAAIMEAICQGLLEGADLPYRLNPDKPVDIYALTEPSEKKFVKDYKQLLLAIPPKSEITPGE
jgi:hypothetical protein